MKIKQFRIFWFLIAIFLFGINNTLWAQNLKVSGTVTDDGGIPLPGVTVLEKGTENGVSTDFNGEYMISVPDNATLTFSYVGFEKLEKNVENHTLINVEMLAATTSLDEVLVVAYGQQKREAVTGAISTISSEELNRSPVANIANSLAGKVTGLSSVQYSGQPGADSPAIFLRGIATLSPDRSMPLIIVDGVERSFSNLDPNEVESISILKDASATAVYGIKGANGVILVTTKRGVKGKPQVNASYSQGLQEPTRLLDFADSYTYAQRYNEAQLNDNPDYGPEDLRFSPEAIKAFKTGSQPILFPSTDWVDYILKPTANQSRGNINITGGTDKVKYFASVGILNQDGLFKTFGSNYDYNFAFHRYNYRTNLDIDVTQTTKLSVTIGGTIGVRNEPVARTGNQLFREMYWAVPMASPGLIDGKYILNGTRYDPLQKKGGLDPFYGRGYTNVLRNQLNLDIGLEQQLNFVKGLKFRTKLSYNTNYTHAKNRTSSVASYEPFYRKDVDPSADPNDKTIVYKKHGSESNLGYYETYDNGRDYYFEAGLEYNRNFKKHHVTGLVLYNQQKTYYPNQFRSIPLGVLGMVGRATYDFSSKYLINLSLGYNGSENFAKGKRFGLFPAVSVGWVLTEEPFMKSISFLDFLKIRASYGLVGNDRIGGNRFLYLPDSYDPSYGGYNFGIDNPINQPGAIENVIGNPNVTWETSEKINLGLDFRFLEERLSLGIDLFKEDRSDILTYRGTVPDYVAYDLPAENIGEVKNKGYEIDARWKDQVHENFSYYINANVSYAHNTIVFQDEVPQNEDYLYRTGKPVNQPFGYVFDKFYEESDKTNPDIPDQQVDLKPGDMVYKDLNGDGIINQNDQKAIGYPEYPEYTIGANFGFQYKNFDLSMSWVGATNTSRLLEEVYREAFGSSADGPIMQYMADGRWTPENADNATFPRLSFRGVQNNAKDSDFWLRDASYVRLKTVEVGYNFTGSFFKKIGLDHLRVFMNGSNLLTFDNLDVTDPEGHSGYDSAYPLIKVYNLGLKADFL